MKRKIFLIGITIIIFLVFNSCESAGPEGPLGPAGPAGPSLKGTVLGFVTLYDEFGVLLDDKSGVMVSADGSDPSLSATTNSVGKYQIDSLQTGIYNLIFSKTGYATRRNLGFSFVGGVEPAIYSTSLSQKTTTLITDLTLIANPVNLNQMIITCTVSPTPATGFTRYFRFYYGKTASVSSTNYFQSSQYGTSSPTTYSSTQTINKVYYPSGTTLYIIAYGDLYNYYSYPDLTTGLAHYSTISTTGSGRVSMVVP
ncbi:MAG: carboxypeptidase-like regulatory domain-containing protein [Bacteroidia bacterium]|nr:carboxypeptidase-like regulatory domain-containing protein [Bacteroidia bacterium]